MLALVLYAMSLCDKGRAGFDPYHLPSPSTLSPPKVPQPNMALPVAEVTGSYFDFTFCARADGAGKDAKASNAQASLEEKVASEDRKGDDEKGGSNVAHAKQNLNYKDVSSPQQHQSTCFRVVDFIRRPDDLITRGTAVYKVQRRLSSGMFSTELYVLKFSWAVKNRLSEISAIQHLRTALPESCHDHIPELFFSQSWTTEQQRLPWLDLQLTLNDKNHQERVLRAFASKYYKKLWQVGSIENFKQAWLDCVEVCYLAFRMGKLLHQDLSENNVMVLALPDGKAKGVLNDWGMAKFVQDQSDQRLDSDHCTGTPPFMAREFLRAEVTRRPEYRRPTPHWLRHDLESLFYILIWAAIQYNLNQGTRDTEYHPFLEDWTKDVALNCGAKTTFIVGGDEEEDQLLEAVKPEFKQVADEWILPLRSLFRKANYLGTRRTKKDTPDSSTYGGHLTFKTFMNAINVTPRTWGIPGYLDDD